MSLHGWRYSKFDAVVFHESFYRAWDKVRMLESKPVEQEPPPQLDRWDRVMRRWEAKHPTKRNNM